jgi:molybdopterin converting factor small subunit
VQRLVGDHPGLGIRRLLFAVNEEYVSPTARLKDGDELAIFTAVSGG